MMENQHKKIKGYRDLNQKEIDLMNEVKNLADQCGSLMNKLQTEGDKLDQRAVSLGKTNLQQGFMWAVRSIAKPESF